MHILTATFAALILADAPASAADVTAFTAESVAAIAIGLGGTNVESKGSLTVFDLNGQKYVFSRELCQKDDPSKCIGLLMASGFKTTPQDTVEVFNDFNKSIGFVTAVKLDNNTMAFGRFVVALGGITADNVKANFGLFSAAPELYNEFVKSQVVSSIGTGGQVLLAQPTAAPAKLQPVALTAEQVAAMTSDALAAKARALLK